MDIVRYFLRSLIDFIFKSKSIVYIATIFFLTNLAGYSFDVKITCEYLNNNNYSKIVKDICGLVLIFENQVDLPMLIFSGLFLIISILLRKYMGYDELRAFNSYDEALTTLGPNQRFLYSQKNIDGVPSPNSSTVGVTQKPK